MTKNSSSLLLKMEGLKKHLRIVNWNSRDDKKHSLHPMIGDKIIV